MKSSLRQGRFEITQKTDNYKHMTTETNIQIVEGDLHNPEHAENFIKLTAAYMSDPMGNVQSWNEEQKETVVREMKEHPCALILFARIDDQYVGICTCFHAYSTFLAKPLLNIHDIYVHESYRGHGVGKMLIQKLEEMALLKGCGKITLEVRKDNLNARDLYKSQGFTEAPHSMFFWTKYL
jgi:ribosomal protein S18 acetylase RimI-like enzyme